MRLLILVSMMLIAVTANTHTTILKQPPKKESSKPEVRITPSFPETDTTADQKALLRENGMTLARLPVLPQEKVFEDLRSAIGDIESDPKLFEQVTQAKAELDELQSAKAESASKLVLWSLNKDALMINLYKTTRDKTYAKAAFENVRTIEAIASSDSTQKATVTVETLPRNGFEVCYTWAEWAELKDPPFLCFANPSQSSENLPKNVNYSFWSRDIQDQKKVGGKTPKFIDGDKTFSIGSPPQ
jgi:hypothetical protein